MANILKTYVLYSETTLQVVPMSLMRRRNFPRIPGMIAEEINSSLCCDGEIPVIIQGGTSKMKAFVLFSKSGLALSGPILRKNKPKNGNWKQIKVDLCCDQTSTSTTTTSSTSTSSSTTSSSTTLI